MKTLATIATLVAILVTGCSAPDNNRPTGNEPKDADAVAVNELHDEALELSAEISEWGTNAATRPPKTTCDELADMEAKTDRLHGIEGELADNGENTRQLVSTLEFLDRGMADMGTYCEAL